MTVRLPMRFLDGTERVETFLRTPEWVMEQKFDGTRGLAVITPGKVEWRHSGGKPLGHTAATQWLDRINPVLMALIGSTPGEIVLDGEIIIGTGEYVVFDLAYARFGGAELVRPSDALSVRRAALETLATQFVGPVSLTRQARTESEKRSMLRAGREAGIEGVMVKHVDGKYVPGARVAQVQKVKFVKSCDVVVTEVNRPDARHGSAKFAVVGDDGLLHQVGACSLIGKPHVEIGDVIEVNYLYQAGPGGSLVQPRMTRVRPDKQPIDCTMEQFPRYTREVI